MADLSADVTPAGANPGVSHPGPAAEEPDPFASWFRPDAYTEAPGGHDDAGTQWQPTQTVSAAPPAAGYPPPTTPHPPYPPTMPPPYPPAAQPARGGRRGLFITVAVVVVLAAGGGAYALASMLGKHGSPQPQPGAAVGASTPGTPGTSTGAASAPA
ncbi:MAG TPA: hypothetical protein VHF26_07880, partial [Trebonia sp.]|nr:hypothetical protein [Trebonia sp.]